MKKNKKKFNGFTLIELLVVIGIIGILASFLFANFVGIRQRARDGVRKNDLRQIQSALEMYKSDNGTYPGDGWNNNCGAQFGSGTTVYLKKIPCDPVTRTHYSYCNYTTGLKYELAACLENVNDPQRDPSNSNEYCPLSPANWSYTIDSP
jgi:general secretion pathway protein G